MEPPTDDAIAKAKRQEPLTDDEQKVIAKVKRRWTLVGVFGFGLTMFVATTALDIYHRREPFALNVADLLFNLALWLTLGYAWSLGMWRYSRKRPRKS
jgi:hypothetical protein